MRVKVYFQMSINLYNAEIEEEKHLITLGHHTHANKNGFDNPVNKQSQRSKKRDGAFASFYHMYNLQW